MAWFYHELHEDHEGLPDIAISITSRQPGIAQLKRKTALLADPRLHATAIKLGNLLALNLMAVHLHDGSVALRYELR
ncbi:MAG: hypothetical protein AAF512_14580, partial [Pseudomonadota bacterium]